MMKKKSCIVSGNSFCGENFFSDRIDGDFIFSFGRKGSHLSSRLPFSPQDSREISSLRVEISDRRADKKLEIAQKSLHRTRIELRHSSVFSVEVPLAVTS